MVALRRSSNEIAQTLAALEASQFLIVITSPNAAQSKYVSQEARRFKMLGRAGVERLASGKVLAIPKDRRQRPRDWPPLVFRDQ